jgi:predicted MarR family transcription regulator
MGIRSLLVLPIKQNAKAVGVLELVSIRPNSFNQDDVAAMSKLADQVLPSVSESVTISDRLDQLPSKDTDVVRDLEANIDVPKENNNILLATTEGAEVAGSNGPDIGSQLPHQTVIMRSQEHGSQVHWLRIGVAATLALGVIGYGYHLSRPRVATHGATRPIAAANHKLATPQQDVLSVHNVKVNGQPKSLDSILTASRQETILAIQEAIQGTDFNRILNRANAGDSIAQYEMALRYADGEGVPQNYQDAMAWFAKAAANGNYEAQWKLGLGYMKGIGVPHDERKAVVWFKRAANQGDIRAQSALSDAYFNGRGIPRDYVRAYTWASIAAGLQGNDSDRVNDSNRLILVGSRMTAVQIVDAHRRISFWWEHRRQRADIPDSSQRTAMPQVSDK